ncbi:MAG TPA: FixG Ig-like domain-containing protein, partial [Bacteroidia bacterium]
HMMESVGLQKGLIRMDSENGIKNKVKLSFTGRMKAYSIVLLILVGVESFLLISRSDYDATVIRAKGMLYQEQPDNEVSNLFTIKLVNKTRKELPVSIKVKNYPEAHIQIIGKDLKVKSEDVTQGSFFLFLKKKDIKKRKTEVALEIYSNDKLIKIVKTNFLGPVSN